MASIVIRNIDDDLKARLRQRARRVLLAAVAHGQRNAVGPGIGPAVKVMHACLLCFF